jgi:protoporphyrinogen oxidase
MKIAIIGGGLTGLVAGYRLSQKGHGVTIFEKGESLGGLMGGFKINGTNLEKTYHHIFSTDKYIIDLITELGLQNRLKWHEEKTALYYDGKMYPFIGAIDLLKFEPLDIISKIRLGLVKLWLGKDNNWKKYTGITAVEWMKKWVGKKNFKVIWEPLLRGKFHEYYNKVSMAWLWARIHTRGNSSKLGYLEGGFQMIIDELQKRILKNNGKILLNYELIINNYELKIFDKIIYTGPAEGIDYLGAVCLVFTSKQSLSKFYWHNINDTKSPFLAFIQHTNLVSKKNYGGENVYYLGTYVPHDHKYFTQDVEKDFFDYLKKIFPRFDKRLVTQKFVFRLKNAQHVVTTDYKVPPRVLNPPPTPPLTRRGDNQTLICQANFAQIFPEDRGINFAVREGNKIAEVILQPSELE